MSGGDGLDPISVKGIAWAPPPARDFGPAPMQRWIAIAELVIDRSYQRDIGERGRGNIRRIAAAFDWSRFAPVVVAPVAGGRFAIIDGQHRTTAAALLGIAEVPCHIVQADRTAQARAFAAINGAVTAITPMQLYHARVTAGDAKALRLQRILDAAEARILKYPVPADLMKPGDTLAAAALMRLAEQFDDDTLIRAIQCVTETGGGNPGMLRAAVMRALAELLGANPAWRDAASALFAAMDALDLADLWERLSGRGPGTVTERFAAAIGRHLHAKLGPGRAA